MNEAKDIFQIILAEHVGQLGVENVLFSKQARLYDDREKSSSLLLKPPAEHS